jgi:anti-sigma factor RsiW
MSFSAVPLSEEDLHGFVDNEVDDERREVVVTHLSHTPADAARVEGWRQQNILLRAAFAQVSLEQVPVSLSCTFTPRLIRGRPDNPAHCLDFVDASATPIVLCISAAKLPPDGDFQSLTTFAANAIYWRESESIYALAAPLEHARLMALAKRIRTRLDAPRTPDLERR